MQFLSNGKRKSRGKSSQTRRDTGDCGKQAAATKGKEKSETSSYGADGLLLNCPSAAKTPNPISSPERGRGGRRGERKIKSIERDEGKTD